MKKKRIVYVGITLIIVALGWLWGSGLFTSDTTSPPSITNERLSKDNSPKQENKVISEVFVQKNTNGTDDGFDKLITNMQNNGLNFYKTNSSENGLIGENDVVLLKINSQWDQRGGTNTDLLKSIIQTIFEHPDKFKGEIIVADNGQAQFGSRSKGGSLDWENSNSEDKVQSAQDVVNYFEGKGSKVSGVLWDEFTENQVQEYENGNYEDGYILENGERSTGLQVSYAKFKTKYGTMVSFKNGIWDDQNKNYNTSRLKVINVPVLKSHSLYQVTGAVKSYMGTTSDKLTKRGAHNSIGNGGMGTQMANTRVPVLNILDAIWIGPDRGPMVPYAQAVKTDIIAASVDPVALDYWASKNILMEAAKKIGNRRSETMNPDGKEPGSFGYWLRLSMEELHKAGIKTTMDENEIGVFISE